MKKVSQRKNAVVRFAFGLIFAVIFASVINMQYELRDLKEKKAALDTKIEDVQDDIQEINVRLNTPHTPDYIERIAKEKLGYRNKSEILYENNIAN